MKKIKVLSLFDGISVAQQALKELGYDVEYYASEIDKYAIQITQKNHSNTIQLGSVTDIKCETGKKWVFGGIDLLIGGSPCQDLSIAGKRAGLAGARSGLFWEYVRILKEVKPKYFVLENVNSMPKEARATITETLGVEPIMINASLVSAQNRKRLFWTNIPNITQPEDKGILLKDILVEKADDKYTLNESKLKTLNREFGSKAQVFEAGDKTNTLTSSMGGGGGNGLYLLVPEATKKGYAVAEAGNSVDLSFPNSKTRRGRVGDKVKNLMTSQNIGVFTGTSIRKLTPIECERLQSLPDNYTDGASDSQRYKMLGNAFNKEVIKHILNEIR